MVTGGGAAVVVAWGKKPGGTVGTRGTPEATLCREVGTGAAMTRGGPGATLSREVGAGAIGTRGTPGAALSGEPGTTPPPPLRALSHVVRAW
jgi:hypothetical protein